MAQQVYRGQSEMFQTAMEAYTQAVEARMQATSEAEVAEATRRVEAMREVFVTVCEMVQG